MMSICAWCEKIRNDKGCWQNINANTKKYSVQSLTHCICNDCAQKEFPELYLDTSKIDQ